MAHRGVLFLDELPEFGTRMLEMLRQPLEDKIIAISRSAGSLIYPANFTLIASMNPCGFFGDPVKECICSITMVKAYPQAKKYPALYWTGSIRFARRSPPRSTCTLWVFEKLSSTRLGEPSAKVRERVERAKAIQRERFKGTEGGMCQG